MNVYISGAMRGHDDLNYPAFNAAAEQLRAAGYFVFNPAETSPFNAGIRECFAIDVAWICAHADAIAMLPGWENSKGAKAELALAEERWTRLVRQFGGLAKVDRVGFYAANCSVISAVA